MSQDASDPSTADLPDGVDDWLADIASEQGVPEEELLSRLLASSNGEGPGADVAGELDAIRAELAELEGRVDDLDDDVDEKVADVRERVIQVKREADAKAPADHGHPDLVSDIGDVAAEVNDLAEEVETMEERVEASLDDVTADVADLGTEMDEFAEDVTNKLNVLAAAVVEMRDQTRTLLAEREKRALIEELRTTANRHDIRTAKCENCTDGVRISLLSEPRCPHCNETFEELDPKEGFFGSDVLRTGAPPALEGDVASDESDLDELITE